MFDLYDFSCLLTIGFLALNARQYFPTYPGSLAFSTILLHKTNSVLFFFLSLSLFLQCSQGILRDRQRRIRGKMEKSGQSKKTYFFKLFFNFVFHFFCFSSRLFGQRQERLWGPLVQKWQSKTFVYFHFVYFYLFFYLIRFDSLVLLNKATISSKC